MYKRFQRFVKLFAHGVIYGALVDMNGGGVYIGEALMKG